VAVVTISKADHPFGRALRAEWTKLRTVRSTTWACIVLVVGTVGLTVLGCANSSTTVGATGDSSVPVAAGDDDIVLFSLAGVYLGQIAVVALATGALTSEFGTGLIRSTFTAMPGRGTVVAAKAAVVTAVVLVLGTIACVMSFYVGQWLLRGNGYTLEGGYPTETLTDGVTARAVFGSALYLGLVGVLSLGIAAIVRHAAGAVSAVLGVLFVPQIMIGLLPDDFADVIQNIAPMSAGLALQQTTGRDYTSSIGPWAGLGVAGAWAAGSLLMGIWLVRRRDV
jgi:ABC-2 type transport system permease protein